ncbi:hypothetical protein DPMN_036544 [Dreissena polymorpha]|uniref:Uncharacterized protein n=1 Tax=Dreissena polymorpha TaxID=45954 RepID=A0A9D4MD60_DREPO|nr:hypothetical protein DPMN_036544 [Dreissena polymorpha]
MPVEGNVNDTTGNMGDEGDIERDDTTRAEGNMHVEGNVNDTTGDDSIDDNDATNLSFNITNREIEVNTETQEK